MSKDKLKTLLTGVLLTSVSLISRAGNMDESVRVVNATREVSVIFGCVNVLLVILCLIMAAIWSQKNRQHGESTVDGR